MPPTSPIVLPSRPHVPLVRCRVQFLGRSAPDDVQDGLLAIQKPLHIMLCDFQPQDAVLTVYTSGISLHQVAGGTGDLWWPIQDLKECAAVRAVGNPVTEFIPLTQPLTSATGLAIFVFVFSRPDIPVSDCWAAVTKSDDAALALLTATEMAHTNRAGWTAQTDRPPSLSRQITSAAVNMRPNQDWDGAIAKDRNNLPTDFYEKPPLNGFFYAPTSALIKQYNVGAMCCETVPTLIPAPVVPPATVTAQTLEVYYPEEDMYPAELVQVPVTAGYYLPEPQSSVIVPEAVPQVHSSKRSQQHTIAAPSVWLPGTHTTPGYFHGYDDDCKKVIDDKSFEQYLPDRGPVLASYTTQDAVVPADYLKPVFDRRYETHISPGMTSHAGGYLDEGPYEHRLPTTTTTTTTRQLKSAIQDNQQLNTNFILRPTTAYRLY